MPTYDMNCGNCGYEGEHFFGMNELNPNCPNCDSKLEKAIQGFNIGNSKSSGKKAESQEQPSDNPIPAQYPIKSTSNHNHPFIMAVDPTQPIEPGEIVKEYKTPECPECGLVANIGQTKDGRTGIRFSNPRETQKRNRRVTEILDN